MEKLVRIIKTSTGEVVKQMGPMPERKANRVHTGVLMQINCKEYHTEVIDAK